MAKVHDYSAQALADRSLNRRAVEAAIWGIPAVNYNLMFQEMVRTTGGTFNQILWWPRLLTWKNQTLTPNPDAIYFMPFINTKEVFTYSSNVGAARIALGQGVEAHKAFLAKMGQTTRLRTELPESASPLVPKRWGELNTVTIAFGQPRAKPPSGENSSTSPKSTSPPTTAAHCGVTKPVSRPHS